MDEEKACTKGMRWIGGCFAGIEADYQLILVNALEREARKAGYRVMYFAAFSSSYISEKHDIGERNVYQLINFKLLDAIILLSETIKQEKTIYFLAEKAKQEKIPVISIDHQVEGCYNIFFDYAAAMERMVRYMVEFHGFRTIEFIGGASDNPQSEERLQNLFACFAGKLDSG